MTPQPTFYQSKAQFILAVATVKDGIRANFCLEKGSGSPQAGKVPS
jgi:hypothetical protein